MFQSTILKPYSATFNVFLFSLTIGLFGFMGGGRGSEPFRTWCTANNKPFSLFRYGTLTGKSINKILSWYMKYFSEFSLLLTFSLIIIFYFFKFVLGGVPGAEPLPFMGLPLLEPELHPSYVLRSVVLTSSTSNQYAASEVCTRKALGEAVGMFYSSCTVHRMLLLGRCIDYL